MTAEDGVAPKRRVVLVTGGSRGIGRATVEHCAAAGWDVALSYRADEAAARDAVAACERMDVRAVAVRADTAVEADVVDLFAAVDERLGRLDALVNNAGVVSPLGRVADYTAERIATVLGINVIGALLCSREAVRRMSTEYGGRGGVIVNVSSIAAVRGGAGEYVDYAASKGALDAITLGLGREVVSEGIRVVGVRPGLIDTSIHAPGRLERVTARVPMGRVGSPTEVAAAIGWLLSDAASYITATTLDVGGGL